MSSKIPLFLRRDFKPMKVFIHLLIFLNLFCFPKARLDHFADGSNGFLIQLISSIGDQINSSVTPTKPEIVLSDTPSFLTEGNSQTVKVSFNKPISSPTSILIQSDNPAVTINGASSINLNFTPDNSLEEQLFVVQALLDNNIVSETALIQVSAEGYTEQSFNVSVKDISETPPEIHIKIGDKEYFSGDTFYFDKYSFCKEKSVTITIENKGEGTLNFINYPYIEVKDEENKNQFSLTSNPVQQILSGQSSTATIKNSPTDCKTLSNGSVIINSNDSKAPKISIQLKETIFGKERTISKMNTMRTNFTTTLLNDEKVLIVGGKNGNTILNSAEIFDPNTETFSYTGSMNLPRFSHFSFLLKDGTVLIVSGTNDKRAELYNPQNGTFSLVGETIDTGHYTGVVLQSGKVLLMSGTSYDPDIEETVYNNLAEIYDPVSQIFSSVANMQKNRGGFSTIVLSDGKVLNLGGSGSWVGWNIHDDSLELFNPVNNTFTLLSKKLLYERISPAVTLLADGKVFIIGGQKWNSLQFVSEIYDPITNALEWIQTPMNLNLVSWIDKLSNGKYLICGEQFMLYDYIENNFNMSNIACSGHSIFLKNDKVLLIKEHTVEIFEP
ncbi:MAG: hypothetical protein H7A25_08365 [Leptospiraceae bacterium]|nr:hypothetical protein [Leptospiraceae bacterium]